MVWFFGLSTKTCFFLLFLFLTFDIGCFLSSSSSVKLFDPFAPNSKLPNQTFDNFVSHSLSLSSYIISSPSTFYSDFFCSLHSFSLSLSSNGGCCEWCRRSSMAERRARHLLLLQVFAFPNPNPAQAFRDSDAQKICVQP